MASQPDPWPGLSKTVEVGQKHLQGHARFQPGDRGAETMMDSVAEGEMPLGWPAEIESLWICPDFGIPVGSAVKQGDHRSRGNHGVPHRHVFGCRASQMLQRRLEAQNLLDRIGN